MLVVSHEAKRRLHCPERHSASLRAWLQTCREPRSTGEWRLFGPARDPCWIRI